MKEIVAARPNAAAVIYPMIGYHEVSNDPRHSHFRYVINFGDMSEQEARSKHPELLEIVERLVKPKRDKDKRAARRERWWRFGDRQPGLYHVVDGLPFVLATASQAASQFSIGRIENRYVYTSNLNVFAFSSLAAFGAMQSRVHENWARDFSSTMGEGLAYAPSDCFRNFPFPNGVEDNPALEEAGQEYHDFRAELMIARDEGLTKTYNRFHDRGQIASDIARLRELHAEMDAAVLRAYGWDDLADRAQPEFIEQDADEGKQAKTRLDWPSEFKDEVLARLLALNAERAEAERAAGLTASDEEGDEDDEGEAA